MNIKENYFRQRNLSLKKENRVIAAKREIDTINFILKEFFGAESYFRNESIRPWIWGQIFKG